MPNSAPLLPASLTIDNITSNVHAINSTCTSPRLKFLLERLVTHLHDFTRETRLSTSEWTSAIQFLTAVGQICSPVRQEFILLSDILGLSLLVDSIDHPKPAASTEGTVLGPFHTHDAPTYAANGATISHDEDGEPMLVACTVRDTRGNPIPGVKVDVWETDSKGFYDVQHADRAGPDGRAVVASDEHGEFHFKAIVPVPYPIPNDGPVGQLLEKLGRHPYRPSHFHFMFEKAGFDPLITALYVRGSPYERSDAVFGVKESLIVDLGLWGCGGVERYGVGRETKLMKYDFVLVGRRRSGVEASEGGGGAGGHEGEGEAEGIMVVDGMLVPDVD
ncbi:hypothetical protein N0V83_004355 [Neocucurbitaria cava]|uniref:Hydroxyquinol 1,2-dioxygenase n=1 Tax=Neocucurbitaria cava TaxID=798079 RepID=A0A9W8Y8Z7_9PLEO|nr:hypothetical protein N0V83_004355 [Neocucurbitaria cava]